MISNDTIDELAVSTKRKKNDRCCIDCLATTEGDLKALCICNLHLLGRIFCVVLPGPAPCQSHWPSV